MSLTRITLSSGRSISLDSVRMSSTYTGFLEGYPFKRLNDRRVASLLRTAEEAHPGIPVHLLEPPRTNPEPDWKGAFGPQELLPAVSCIGLFTGDAVAQEQFLYISRLVVAWYQPTPELSAPADAVPGLAELPWEELAQDWEL